jgi:hypothetical protein
MNTIERIIGRLLVIWLGVAGLAFGLVGPAAAAPDRCPPDSVPSGTVCIDKYEASVWETTDARLIVKIKQGTATLADLISAGAIQHGVLSDDYAPGCPHTGNGCVNFYAVSIPGVTPSSFLNWFQAIAVARNAGKRLPTNAEWQAAAFGTPDGPPCIVTPPVLPPVAAPTGTAGCVSDVGTFDMVGNVWEWVAEWVPKSASCIPPLFPGTDDWNCLVDPSSVEGPGALARGGNFFTGTGAGIFTVITVLPSNPAPNVGFRGVR